MSGSSEHPANTYYIHPAGDSGPSVLVNLELVDSIAQWAVYAASQGREIRGVLFGRADVDPDGPTVLAVEDCEPLVDHVPVHGGGMRPVGLIRSDLSGTLLADDDDREALRRTVAEPNRILMLVTPGPDATARILPDGTGGGAPFPLQRAKLSQHPRQTLRVPSARAASGKALAVVAVLAALAGAAFWTRGRSASARVTQEGGVPVSVSAAGSNYRVSWDPNAPAVRSAGSGVLHVTERGGEQAIPLTAEQLASGAAPYHGQTAGAQFRLELDDGGTPTAEAKADLPKPEAGVPAAQADEENLPETHESAPPRREAESRKAGERTEDADAKAVRVPDGGPRLLISEADRHVGDPGERRHEEAAPAPPPPAPAPAPEPVAERTDRSPTRPAAAARNPVFATTVSYRAAPESAIRRGIQKVPGLRALQRWRFKGGDKFEPARPTREAKPHVPPRVAPTLPAFAHVDIEVYLDEHGKVSGVEVETPGVNDHLVGAATSAVYASSFEPARLNGKPVESRLIASFDFRKAS